MDNYVSKNIIQWIDLNFLFFNTFKTTFLTFQNCKSTIEKQIKLLIMINEQKYKNYAVHYCT